MKGHGNNGPQHQVPHGCRGGTVGHKPYIIPHAIKGRRVKSISFRKGCVQHGSNRLYIEHNKNHYSWQEEQIDPFKVLPFQLSVTKLLFHDVTFQSPSMFTCIGFSGRFLPTGGYPLKVPAGKYMSVLRSNAGNTPSPASDHPAVHCA